MSDLTEKIGTVNLPSEDVPVESEPTEDAFSLLEKVSSGSALLFDC